MPLAIRHHAWSLDRDFPNEVILKETEKTLLCLLPLFLFHSVSVPIQSSFHVPSTFLPQADLNLDNKPTRGFGVSSNPF